jgi:hypothetical protein
MERGTRQVKDGNEIAVFCGKTQLESPEQSDLGSRIQASERDCRSCGARK